MPVKLRLQRHGKKVKPFYWVVAADARAKRDGKYLEKIGTYNPNVNPAIINVDVDAAVKWLQDGAQPTDTARAILSYKGVMLKNHLVGGVRKGAITEEQAEAKFTAWLDEKAKNVESKKDSLTKASDAKRAKSLAAEKEVNDARLAKFQEAKDEAKAAADAKIAEAEAAKEAPESIDDAAKQAEGDS